MDKRIISIEKRLLTMPQTNSDISLLKPDLYPKNTPKNPPHPAAVLITLVPNGNDYNILYTKRSNELRAHSGQISFPGGKIDKSDKDAASAALREANEEVAIEPKDVQILGYLPTMFTGTNYLITPVVGVLKSASQFKANPSEVDEIFEVPLSFLSRNDVYEPFKVFHGNQYQLTWKIEHENRVIWGITANLTRAFKDLALVGEYHE